MKFKIKQSYELPLLLAILATSMYFVFHLGGLTAISGLSGFSTISVDKVDFVSNDPQLAGPAIMLTTSTDGGAEYATGTYTNLGEFELNQPLTLTMNMTKNNCLYNIIDSGEVLNTFGTTMCSGHVDCPPSGNCWMHWTCPENCIVHYGWTIYPQGGPQEVHGCLMQSPALRVGQINTVTQYDWNVKVGLLKGNETNYIDINPSNTTGMFASGIGRTKTIGSLIGSQSCPAASANVITGRGTMSNASYKLMNNIAYMAYRNMQYNIPGGTGEAGYKAAQSWVGTMNSKYNEMVAGVNGSSPQCVSQTIVNGTSVSGAKYICIPTQAAVYPVMQTVIKADWLGIGVNVGKPKITWISSTPIFEINFTNYPMKIKNIGNATATFDVSTSCTGGSVTSRAMRESYAPGEEKQINLEIDATAGTYNCNVTAYDVNKVTSNDTVAFTFTIMKSVCPSDFMCCLSTSSYQEKLCPIECETNTWTGINGQPVSSTTCYEQMCASDFICHRGNSTGTYNINCSGACGSDENINVREIAHDEYECICVPSVIVECERDSDCGAGNICFNKMCAEPGNPPYTAPTATPLPPGVTPTPPITGEPGQPGGVPVFGAPSDSSWIIPIVIGIIVLVYFTMVKKKRR